MQVIWYWLKEKVGSCDQNGEFRNCYAKCLNFVWVLTNEEHDWIPIELGWVSWAPKTNRLGKYIEDMTVVYKISMEKKICILHSMKPHLQELIARQSDQWDDEHLQHDIEQWSQWKYKIVY